MSYRSSSRQRGVENFLIHKFHYFVNLLRAGFYGKKPNKLEKFLTGISRKRRIVSVSKSLCHQSCLKETTISCSSFKMQEFNYAMMIIYIILYCTRCPLPLYFRMFKIFWKPNKATSILRAKKRTLPDQPEYVERSKKGCEHVSNWLQYWALIF